MALPMPNERRSSRRFKDSMFTNETETKSKWLTGGILLLVALGCFFWWRNAQKAPTLENSFGVVQPLIIKADLSALTKEQEQTIADFRRAILARAKSSTPLTSDERFTLRRSLGTGKGSFPSGRVIVDQATFQFTPKERALISEALER